MREPLQRTKLTLEAIEPIPAWVAQHLEREVPSVSQVLRLVHNAESASTQPAMKEKPVRENLLDRQRRIECCQGDTQQRI